MHTGEAVGRTEVEQSVLLARSAGKLRVRKDSQSVIREGFTEEAAAVLDLKELGFLDRQKGREGISRGGSTGTPVRRLQRQRQSGWLREQRRVGQHRHPHHHIY